MTVFRPTGAVYPQADGFTLYGADVIGGEPQWADDDDASYASFNGGHGPPSGIASASARANFDDGTFAEFLGLSFTVILGYKLANIDGALAPDDGAGFMGIADGLTSSVAWQYIRFGDLVDGWNYFPPISFPNEDPNADVFGTSDDLCTATGVFAFVVGTNEGIYTAHVYDVLEFSVELVPEVLPTATRVPPLRRWPVDNGAMGPTRHFPRPSSGRGVGGYR